MSETPRVVRAGPDAVWLKLAPWQCEALDEILEEWLDSPVSNYCLARVPLFAAQVRRVLASRVVTGS